MTVSIELQGLLEQKLTAASQASGTSPDLYIIALLRSNLLDQKADSDLLSVDDPSLSLGQDGLYQSERAQLQSSPERQRAREEAARAIRAGRENSILGDLDLVELLHQGRRS